MACLGSISDMRVQSGIRRTGSGSKYCPPSTVHWDASCFLRPTAPRRPGTRVFDVIARRRGRSAQLLQRQVPGTRHQIPLRTGGHDGHLDHEEPGGRAPTSYSPPSVRRPSERHQEESRSTCAHTSAEKRVARMEGCLGFRSAQLAKRRTKLPRARAGPANQHWMTSWASAIRNGAR